MVLVKIRFPGIWCGFCLCKVWKWKTILFVLLILLFCGEQIALIWFCGFYSRFNCADEMWIYILWSEFCIRYCPAVRHAASVCRGSLLLSLPLWGRGCDLLLSLLGKNAESPAFQACLWLEQALAPHRRSLRLQRPVALARVASLFEPCSWLE